MNVCSMTLDKVLFDIKQILYLAFFLKFTCISLMPFDNDEMRKMHQLSIACNLLLLSCLTNF